MRYQQHPDSVLWVPRQDGVLCGAVYEPEKEILGWSRHFGRHSLILDAAITRPNGNTELFIVSSMLGSDKTTRYQMLCRSGPCVILDEQQWHHEPTNAPTNTFKITNYYGTNTVDVLIDGLTWEKVVPSFDGDDWTITTQTAGLWFMFGYHFDQKLKTLPFDIVTSDGQTQSTPKHQGTLFVRVSTEGAPVIQGQAGQVVEETENFKNFRVHDYGHKRFQQIEVVNNSPDPMEIIGVYSRQGTGVN